MVFMLLTLLRTRSSADITDFTIRRHPNPTKSPASRRGVHFFVELDVGVLTLLIICYVTTQEMEYIKWWPLHHHG